MSSKQMELILFFTKTKPQPHTKDSPMFTAPHTPEDFLPIDTLVYRKRSRKKRKDSGAAPRIKGAIGWAFSGGKMNAYFWDALSWRLVRPNERKRAIRARIALEELEAQYPAVAGLCTD
jgi:hypothetical protein